MAVTAEVSSLFEAGFPEALCTGDAEEAAASRHLASDAFLQLPAMTRRCVVSICSLMSIQGQQKDIDDMLTNLHTLSNNRTPRRGIRCSSQQMLLHALFMTVVLIEEAVFRQASIDIFHDHAERAARSLVAVACGAVSFGQLDDLVNLLLTYLAKQRRLLPVLSDLLLDESIACKKDQPHSISTVASRESVREVLDAHCAFVFGWVDRVLQMPAYASQLMLSTPFFLERALEMQSPVVSAAPILFSGLEILRVEIPDERACARDLVVRASEACVCFLEDEVLNGELGSAATQPSQARGMYEVLLMLLEGVHEALLPVVMQSAADVAAQAPTQLQYYQCRAQICRAVSRGTGGHRKRQLLHWLLTWETRLGSESQRVLM